MTLSTACLAHNDVSLPLGGISHVESQIDHPIICGQHVLLLAWPPPAEPRGEKKLFFVQILGGEKLLKFGEKWAVKNF